MDLSKPITSYTLQEVKDALQPQAGHAPLGGPTPDVMPTPTPYFPPTLTGTAKLWKNVFEIMQEANSAERRRFTDMNVQELVEFSQIQRGLPEVEQTKFWPRY